MSRTRLLSTVAASVLLGAGLLASHGLHKNAHAQHEADLDQPVALTINTRPLAHFFRGPQGDTGALTFVGGLVLTSDNPHLGALSGLRLRGDRLYAIADTGLWLTARLERAPDGRPLGLSDATIAPLRDGQGLPLTGKDDGDAEGLELLGEGEALEAVVSFERRAPMRRYHLGREGLMAPGRVLPVPASLGYLRHNRGLEAIVSPTAGPLSGRIIVIAEETLDANGNHRAAVVGDDGFGFSLRRRDGFAVTDAASAPNGDLFVLERRFALAEGIRMRIRHIEAAQITPGALVDGSDLIVADMSSIIDNMEGLAVSLMPAQNGENEGVFLTLVSDDNHNFFQRTVLLTFRLTGEESFSAPAPQQPRTGATTP